MLKPKWLEYVSFNSEKVLSQIWILITCKDWGMSQSVVSLFSNIQYISALYPFFKRTYGLLLILLILFLALRNPFDTLVNEQLHERGTEIQYQFQVKSNCVQYIVSMCGCSRLTAVFFTLPVFIFAILYCHMKQQVMTMESRKKTTMPRVVHFTFILVDGFLSAADTL